MSAQALPSNTVAVGTLEPVLAAELRLPVGVERGSRYAGATLDIHVPTIRSDSFVPTLDRLPDGFASARDRSPGPPRNVWSAT
jgi:hypothetical protein